MNYELAKQLKDAGFLQGTGRYFLEGGEHASGSTKEVEFLLSSFDAKDTKRYKFAYVPTLEELIEACGEQFGSFARFDDTWFAYNYGRDIKSTAGTTPSEAVARLWLSLQQQK
jgi:hypothetical protein